MWPRSARAIGYEIPLGADHFGHIDVNSCIRLGKALEPYQMAWLEDMVPWEFTDLRKEITHAIDVPTLTGEDIYCLDGFKDLIDQNAVDMIHPDLATAGGILETKKIGDYAQGHGDRDGDALRGLADLLHGQRPLRRGHRELRRAGASRRGCPLVGGPRHGHREAAAPARASRRCPRRRAWESS